MIKVSVVVPIYNVERYLRQCLDSIAAQTLTDIEVICVNDGSTDSSPDIIREYVEKDPRFKLLDKANSGYGASMNCGFDMAQGEYIGIVESDDYAEPDMFETLYSCAKENELDVCKAGFFFYYSSPEEKNIPSPIASRIMCQNVFCPTTDFECLREQIAFFDIKPTIWSSVYRRDFIRSNGIRFNETPGASFQDTSFNFKVWSLAKRVKLLEDCVLHYRQDNENSSINSTGKVFCVCDEYAEMERFLRQHPELAGRLEVVKNALKYDTYMWNYERLAPEQALEFIKVVSEEFCRDMREGVCYEGAYPSYKWGAINHIAVDPLGAHEARMRDRAIARGEYVEPNIVQKCVKNIKTDGLFATLKKIFSKIGRVFSRK